MDDFRKFAHDLRGLDHEVKREMETALDRTVPSIVAVAVSLLPPNTGIRMAYTSAGMSRSISAIGVDPESEEYGTSQKAPNPFLMLALMASMSRFMNESGSAIDRALK